MVSSNPETWCLAIILGAICKAAAIDDDDKTLPKEKIGN